MRRGEIWTVSGANDYAGKPRPTVIVQDDAFETYQSITVCGLTSDYTGTDLLRIVIQPNVQNGLTVAIAIMIDKVTTIPRTKLGKRIGTLSGDEMTTISQAIIVFLGLGNAYREVE